ncbi:hypothetical protein I5R71_15840 [Serratia marcescens]|nr:hypothetical protein [Serratia marcescens]
MTTIKRFTPDYKMHAVRFEAFAREAEHGELVRFDAHQQVVSALEAERDALAVENQALKVAVDGFNQELYGKGFEVLGWHLNGDTEPLDNWFGENDWNPETPATDAALAAIRTESHIAGVEAAANRIGVISLQYKAGQKQELIRAIGREVFQYANELREAK